MTEQEQHTKIGFVEKGLWWAKVGGIVAAVIGMLRQTADIAFGGAAVTATAFGLEGILYRRKQHVNASG